MRPRPRSKIAVAENGPMPLIASSAAWASAYGAVRSHASPSIATPRITPGKIAARRAPTPVASQSAVSRPASSGKGGIARST